MSDGQFNGARPAEDILYRHLRDSGGSANMGVDGSGTPVEFCYAAEDGELIALERVMVLIVDAAVKIDKFGGLTALDNGLLIEARDAQGQRTLDFGDGDAIKTNSDWVLLAGTDVNIQTGVGVDMCAVRWTVGKTGTSMRMKPGEKFVVTVRDNLSALTEMFHIVVQGQKYDISG